MEAKQLRNSRDDLTNEQRSFGNCLPHSQSQKISIGVLAEATKKMNSGAKDDGAALKSAKNEASCRNLVEENFKRTSTKSLHQPTQTVQSHGKESPFLQSNKKSNSISSGRSVKKARNMEKAEELVGATVPESNELNKGKQEEKATHQSNETLRMKLSEILGSASSQTKKSLSFETPHHGVKGLTPEGHFDQKNIKAANSRQNLDTIENDSASPNETKWRPVTRSLTRKKAPTKPGRKMNHTIDNRGNLPHSPMGGCGQKRRNIFSFSEEIWSQNINVAPDINTCSLISRKSERNHGKLEQKKNCVSPTIAPEKRQQKKTQSSAQKSTSHGRAGNFHGHLRQDDQKELQSVNEVMKEIHNSPARKKRYQQEDANSPHLPGETCPQEDFHCFSSKKNEDLQFDDNNQTLGLETPIQNSSPYSSATKSKQTKQGANSPAAAERQPEEKDFSNSRTLRTSKAGSFRFDVEPEFSDEFEEPKVPSIRKSSPDEEEKLSGDGMSQSSSEQDTDSFEEDPKIKKGPKPIWTPESDDCETISFLRHSSKMLYGQGGIRINEFSSPLPSLKEFAGTQQSSGLEGPSDGHNEDSLARAVALFALALERVRNKMKLLMTKRSTELLAAVAEETQLQLQNVESQIATDVKKFTILEESKRKSLEKKFQEQKEHLIIMHEKFKDDMNKHLEDCQRTLKELEIYQREQKGNAGKLKSLHKKLLLQVEEGIGSQLSDAERRIMTVQKVARQKMFQLRHVIKEFLSEDD